MSLPQKEKSCWGKWGNLSTRDVLCYTRAYFDVGCCNIFIAVESNERFLHPTNGPTSTLLWAMSHQIMCLDTQMSLATAQPGAIHWSVLHGPRFMLGPSQKRWLSWHYFRQWKPGWEGDRLVDSFDIYLYVRVFQLLRGQNMLVTNCLGAAGFSFVATNTFTQLKKSSPGSSSGDLQVL